MLMTDAEVLARCPLFAQLSDGQLEALASIAHRRSFDRGAMLFWSGDLPQGLHVVVAGRVRIFVISPQTGRELVLTMEYPYRAVAELPSFDGGHYPANAQAVVDTETLFLPQDLFESLLQSTPGLAQHLLRNVGRRLRQLVALVEQLSFQEVIHRLARHLLEERRKGLPLQLETNAVIAAQLGTVPELVSRNLARLLHSGAITLEGRVLVAVDEGALEELAAATGR